MLRRAQLSSVCDRILTSVFMAMYCPKKKIYRPLKAATELLAGIPSVVYGFFGLVVVVPIIRDFGRALKDAGLIKNAGDGNSILTTSLILAMMIPSDDYRNNRKRDAGCPGSLL